MLGSKVRCAIVVVPLVGIFIWLRTTGGRLELDGILDSPVVAAVIASSVVALGWFVTARKQSEVSLEQARRQFRTQYLVDIFRAAAPLLEPIDGEAAHEEYISTDWERVLDDMQLFGSDEQLKLVQNLHESLRRGEDFNPHQIVESMRMELRDELGLSPAPSPYTPFRVTRPLDSDVG